MKVGVISDGISQDLANALEVLKTQNLQYVELQFVWNKEVGLHTKSENEKIIELISKSKIEVTSLSSYALKEVPYYADFDNESYKKSLKQIINCFELANALEVEYVRVIGLRYETILFASGGAENFMADTKAWDGQIRFFEALAALAEKYKQKVLLETCKAGMVTTLALGAKLMEELKSPYIHLLWDPYNALFFSESASIEMYRKYKEYIKHIHVKDGFVDIPNAKVETTAIGKGSLKTFYAELGSVLREEKFKGGISLESIYQAKGKTRYEGCLESLPYYKKCFMEQS